MVRENSGTIFCFIEWQTWLYIYLAGFLKKVTPKYTFRQNSFFRPKVAIIKTKSATIAFFLFSSFLPPRCFFFSFFYFAGVIFELIGRKKPAFWPFFTQMVASLVNRFVFLKNRLDIYCRMYSFCTVNPRYSEQIMPVPCPFVVSRSHCILFSVKGMVWKGRSTVCWHHCQSLQLQ